MRRNAERDAKLRGRAAAASGRVMLWRVVACLLVLLLAAAAVRGQEGAEVRLAEQPWQEGRFGLTLRPPAEAAQAPAAPGDEALQRWRLGEDASLAVYLRESRDRVNMETVKKRAAEQFGFKFPSSVILNEREEERQVEGHPLDRLLIKVLDPERGDWFFGQAFLLIDPTNVAVLQVEAPFAQRERAQAVFDAVVGTMRLIDPEAIDRLREAQVQAGDVWLQRLTADDFRDLVREEQWFRIVHDGRDVGYQRNRMSEANELGADGITLSLQRRVILPELVEDAKSDFFVSLDRQTEVWSRRRTLRPTTTRDQPRQPTLTEHGGVLRPKTPVGEAPRQERDSAETGLTSDDLISVSREVPDKRDDLAWPRPPEAYLSQLGTMLLPRKMLDSVSSRMAFYAYDPASAAVVLRTTRREPNDRGGQTLYIRPAPDRDEEAWTFDARGELIELTLPGGLRFVPATAAQIAAIWGIDS